MSGAAPSHGAARAAVAAYFLVRDQCIDARLRTGTAASRTLSLALPERMAPSGLSALRIDRGIVHFRIPLVSAPTMSELRAGGSWRPSGAADRIAAALGVGVARDRAAGDDVVSAASVDCRVCRQALLRATDLRRVCDLPSADWLETADAWICHRGERTPRLSAEAVAARPRVLLVSETYLLVHGSDLEAGGGVVMEDASATAAMAPGHADEQDHGNDDDDDNAAVVVRCARCRSPLGDAPEPLGASAPRLGDGDDHGGVAGRPMRLLRHHLRIRGTDGRDVLSASTADAMVAARLLDAARGEACFRFRIVAGTRTYLLLQLLGWDLHVAGHAMHVALRALRRFGPFMQPMHRGPIPGTAALTDAIQSVPVVRVLYCAVGAHGADGQQEEEPQQPHDAQQSLERDWCADPRVGELQLTRRACLELLLVLRATTLALPRGRRTMRGLRIGYLRRLV